MLSAMLAPPIAPGHARWLLPALGMVAALAIAGCGPRGNPGAGGAATPAEDSTALVIEPGAAFTWPRVPRAEVYRIELYDAAGQLLAGAVTRDTTVPADAVVPDTAMAGIWRVVPVSAGGTELTSSELRGFRRR